MQVANCHVRLSGDLNNEIFKSEVTPPEIVILRAIHGSDAVVQISPIAMDKRKHGDEIDRLKKEYGDKLFTSVFPGSSPNLPVSLSDIGINVYSEKPARAKRGAANETADAADAAAAGE